MYYLPQQNAPSIILRYLRLTMTSTNQVEYIEKNTSLETISEGGQATLIK